MSRTFALIDIVDKINGGGIIPIGETKYDNAAFLRMKEVEELADCLIDDMMRVYERKGNESSIEQARNEAKKWFKELRETIDEILKDDANE